MTVIIPTIMSGGSGARLWPISRRTHPKQFIRLADGFSLVQHAFFRASALASSGEILTITNRGLFFETEDEYGSVNRSNLSCRYILEPEGRDTAAAAASASLYVRQVFGEDAVIVLFPADHLIKDTDIFIEAAERAVKLAEEGKLATFGIVPTRPETAYGYIETDGEQVLRFVEKPDVKEAENYLASGNFLWNAGIFCFTAGTMIDLMKRFAPDILELTARSLETAHRSEVVSGEQISLDPLWFEQVPKISIDYAVLEKADNIAVITCDVGWSDIGSWDALAHLVSADENGNRVSGEAVLLGCQDCYIHETSRMISAIGVKDLLIVDTADALLVVHKDESQKVKQIYERLKENEHPVYQGHRTVYRAWGSYTLLEEGAGFRIRRIVVKPEAELNKHYHVYRSEHWVVVSGTARVLHDGEILELKSGESTFIPAGHKHQLSNPSSEPLIIIEVQHGDHLSEQDSVFEINKDQDRKKNNYTFIK